MGASFSTSSGSACSRSNRFVSATRSASVPWSVVISSLRCSRADATAAPSIGGWSGPANVIVPPHMRTRSRSFAVGNTRQPPLAAKALLSDVATTVRSPSGMRERKLPRPCRPAQLMPCASSMYSRTLGAIASRRLSSATGASRRTCS